MGKGIRVRAREVGGANPPDRTILKGSLVATEFSVPIGANLVIDRLQAADMDFGHMDLWGLVVMGSAFDRCDFSELRSTAVPQFGTRPRSIYRDCHFDRIKFERFDPGMSRFERCTFADVEISGARIERAEFVECTFSGRISNTAFYGRPDERGAAFLDPPRSTNEFRGNDFTGARLRGVDFSRGIDVMAQRWPLGADYVVLDRLAERLRVFRTVVKQWPGGPRRDSALALEKFLSEHHPEAAAFVQKSTYSFVPTNYRDEIWDELVRAV